VIVFIDDIVIYSKNEEEHVKHLATMLIFLREHWLYAKLSMCILFQKKVHYLGQGMYSSGPRKYQSYHGVGRLTNVPVLKISYLDKEFMVCANDYKRGLGGVLMQEGHVV